MKLQQGSIVWVQVTDPAGRHRKRRPAVIVTPTVEINDSNSLVVVAVTSSVPDPIPESAVEIPWHSEGHPVTGLFKRCIANCAWVPNIKTHDIERVGGIVPTKQLRQILALVAAHSVNPTQTDQGP